MSRKTRLAILWHMHQPCYRNPASGRFDLPWLRLHALKDYFGMVHMLEEFPSLRLTFNLVPSLLAGLERYLDGDS
ncbi:MAG TPA: glycoside hydrolase, partial [Acidobacteriota bacterium]